MAKNCTIYMFEENSLNELVICLFKIILAKQFALYVRRKAFRRKNLLSKQVLADAI